MKPKLLQNLVRKLVEAGFKNGIMVESQVIKAMKLLKSLPRSQAIFALSEYLASRRPTQLQPVTEEQFPLPDLELFDKT